MHRSVLRVMAAIDVLDDLLVEIAFEQQRMLLRSRWAGMNQELRFAVIGAGGFARFAVAQFIKREGARLVGVYDNNPGCVRSMTAEHPGIKGYESFDELLSDRPDRAFGKSYSR